MWQTCWAALRRLCSICCRSSSSLWQCSLPLPPALPWGTFSILIPIVCQAFPDGEMLVVSIAACLSGAVCGDHCSPISDTTIMASAGAHCSHVNHVSTQLPYAITAAACSAVCYIITGLAQAVLGSRASLCHLTGAAGGCHCAGTGGAQRHPRPHPGKNPGMLRKNSAMQRGIFVVY